MKILGLIVFSILSIITLGSYEALNVISDTTSDDDTIDGTFESSGYNNPTEVTNFVFTKSNTDTAIGDGGSLTPQEEYYVKFEVLDYDSFQDVEFVELVFYSTNTALSVDPSTGTNGAMAVFEWNRNDAYTSVGAIGLSSTSGAVRTISNTLTGITWEVTNSTVPALSSLNSVTEAAFEFTFKISKVAEQGTNNWQFGYVIKDGLENLQGQTPDFNIVSNTAIQEGPTPDAGAFEYSMAWYGEIEVPAGGISWTAITPGMEFDDANSLQTTGAIKYISNGNYIEKVSVSEVWTATQAALDNVGNANLTSSSMITNNNPPQTFALKVVTGTGLSGSFSASGSGEEFVTENNGNYSAEITLSNETYLADEAGRQKIYQLKVKTSTDLQNATYEGQIKFTISNQ